MCPQCVRINGEMSYTFPFTAIHASRCVTCLDTSSNEYTVLRSTCGFSTCVSGIHPL